MLAPGAIAVLRYVSFGSHIISDTQIVKKTRPTEPSRTVLLTLKLPPNSYKNNNIDEPAFHLGLALPKAETSDVI
jgi:hypothetical protein